jgi:uncharacterized protein YqfA (UPF0365 family)
MLLAESPAVVIVAVGVLSVLVIAATFILSNAALWFQAYMCGVRLSLPRIIAMRFRKCDPRAVVRTIIVARHVGIELSPSEVEWAYLQGADLEKIHSALVLAKRDNVDITFGELVDADLQERTGQQAEE